MTIQKHPPLAMKDLVKSSPRILIVVAVIWIVELINFFSGYALNQFGIVPRSATGLMGIPLSPFLHGSIGHTISNTVPLLVLGGLVSLKGTRVFTSTSIAIALLGGFGVWLVAGGGIHIGASGLVFGYFGYLVAGAWFERNPASMLLAGFTLLLYSSIVWGVLPGQPGVSWQAHLFGLIAGVLVSRGHTSKLKRLR